MPSLGVANDGVARDVRKQVVGVLWGKRSGRDMDPKSVFGALHYIRTWRLEIVMDMSNAGTLPSSPP